MKSLLSLFGKGNPDDGLRRLRKWAGNPGNLPQNNEEEHIATKILAQLPAENSSARAEVLLRLGRIRFYRGNAAGAVEALVQSASTDLLCEDVNWHAGLMEEMKQYGLYPEAIQYAHHLNEAYRSVHDMESEMVLSGMLGQLFKRAGEIEQSFECTARGYGLAKALGNKREEQVFLLDTAQLHIARHDYTAAMEWAERARDVTPGADVPHVLGVLATCASNLDRFDDAREFIQRGLAVARRLGDKGEEAAFLFNAGETEGKQGRHAAAVTELDRAVQLYLEIGNIVLALYVGASLLKYAREAGDVTTFCHALDRHAWLCNRATDEVRGTILGDVIDHVKLLAPQLDADQRNLLGNVCVSITEKNPEPTPEIAFLVEFLICTFLVQSGQAGDARERAARLDEVSNSVFEVQAFLASLTS